MTLDKPLGDATRAAGLLRRHVPVNTQSADHTLHLAKYGPEALGETACPVSMGLATLVGAAVPDNPSTNLHAGPVPIRECMHESALAPRLAAQVPAGGLVEAGIMNELPRASNTTSPSRHSRHHAAPF